MPDETRMALADTLRGIAIPGRPVPPENWHLTLRFLGGIDRVTCERLLGAIDQTGLGGRFRIALRGLGAFPRPSKATVVWLGVAEGRERLEDLADIAEEAAVDAGVAPEDRPFRPHLTLSRVRPEEDVTELVETGADLGIGWRCESIVVYRSHLGRGGARYEPLETFSLSR